jgi:hypothetical protein
MQPSHSGTNDLPRAWVDMQWIEALINVSALVGFVGVATHWPKISDRLTGLAIARAAPPLR